MSVNIERQSGSFVYREAIKIDRDLLGALFFPIFEKRKRADALHRRGGAGKKERQPMTITGKMVKKETFALKSVTLSSQFEAEIFLFFSSAIAATTKRYKMMVRCRPGSHTLVCALVRPVPIS